MLVLSGIEIYAFPADRGLLNWRVFLTTWGMGNHLLYNRLVSNKSQFGIYMHEMPHCTLNTIVVEYNVYQTYSLFECFTLYNLFRFPYRRSSYNMYPVFCRKVLEKVFIFFCWPIHSLYNITYILWGQAGCTLNLPNIGIKIKLT